ncbi:Threonine synthase [Buchnera aphidicola (Thelaxes suberi)]|uniref:threonine synthase n=1 Tax=Buchnera aphidicola TaxID=9 RepID=UPI0034649789
MKLYNLKNHSEEVSFSEAVKLGLGTNQGLFFPTELPEISKKQLDQILKMDFISRSSKILGLFIGNEISKKDLYKTVQKSFDFPGPIIHKVEKNISCLEVFHGPTLAFKDFGARFMAQILSYFNKNNDEYVTILTATSGDTGAAVAHAFYKMHNIRVVILYPKGKISEFQKKMFCTLGKNITTIAIDGSFDDCQSLVKQAFQDEQLRKKTGLNSANSINISRLLAQICYYFEAYSMLPENNRNKLIISIPCGNFGNLTAGLLAKSLGLPIQSFIAATNSNDTVPRFLKTGIWKPNKTVSTISNAMDISQPNNWPRVEELFKRKKWNLKDLGYGSLSDTLTKETLLNLHKINYISEPHAAIAYRLLKKQLKKDEYGLFLGTAHPSKFKTTIEKILNTTIPIPQELLNQINLPSLSYNMVPNFLQLKDFLLKK